MAALYCIGWEPQGRKRLFREKTAQPFVKWVGGKPPMLICQAIAESVEEVIVELERYQKGHNKEYYLQARKKLSEEKDKTVVAGLFVYLNKTCYNGFYRLNKHGDFNVSLGRCSNSDIIGADNLRLAAYAKSIDDAGMFFLPSNSDIALIRELCRDYDVGAVSEPSSVSHGASRKGRGSELLIRTY